MCILRSGSNRHGHAYISSVFSFYPGLIRDGIDELYSMLGIVQVRLDQTARIWLRDAVCRDEAKADGFSVPHSFGGFVPPIHDVITGFRDRFVGAP